MARARRYLMPQVRQRFVIGRAALRAILADYLAIAPDAVEFRYRDQGKPFMAFVYGIASHKVADAMRVAARVKSDPVEEIPEVSHVTGGPEQVAIDADGSRRMRALLGILPEKQREVLVLRLIVGMSAEETAQAIGSTAGAVRVAQHRALAKLKDELRRTGGHDERTV